MEFGVRILILQFLNHISKILHMNMKLPTLTPTQTSLLLLAITVVTSLFTGSGAFAQGVSTSNPYEGDSNEVLNAISTPEQLLWFIINILRWLGWAGVLVGVSLALFGLIYKLLNEDNEKTMKTVQGYITKAVVIVIAGVLLVSAGFLIRAVAGLFGLSLSQGQELDPVNDSYTGT